MTSLTALLSGIIFGAALALSGMTDTQKVLGFLNIFGDWDITLMFVMGAGLLVTVPTFHFILKWPKPLLTKGLTKGLASELDSEFCLPQRRVIDARLIGGALIFGVGWGLYGLCPGPAISSLAYLTEDVALFVLAMLVGMYLANKALAMAR